MRKIFTIISAVLLTATIWAQSPEKMSYQAIIRNSSDQLVTNQDVGMQISILQSSVTGAAVYVATQTSTTNANGLVTIEIGLGTTTDDFSAIDWANGIYFIKTETDPTGGTNYTITGTSQLLSVPYALHAKSADNFTGEITFTETDPAFTTWDKTTGVSITESQISNLNHFTNSDESDPVYSQSIASSITATDTSNWNSGQDSFTETDPVYLSSQAANITTIDITNLGNLSGTNTGDQDISAMTHTNRTALDAVSGINSGDQDLSTFISTESDPTYTSSQAANITTIDITNLGNLSGTNTGDQDISAMTHTNRTALDAVSGVNTGDQDLSTFISTESDPTYTSSQAANITTTDITNLGNLSGANTGNQDLGLIGNELSITNGSTVTLPGSNSNVPIYTTSEIMTLTPTQGDAVFNSSENLYQIYDGNEWKMFSSDCWPQPTTANAGSDQTFTDGTATATISANTPEVGHGTGQWTIVSGPNGSFIDENSPSTTFNVTLYDIYTLRWSIVTNCRNSIDDLVITFRQDGEGSTLTDIDGNTYNTVWIDTQLWMAENLKVTHYPNSTAIPLVTNNTTWADLDDNDTDDAYCYYGNNSSSGYGALYTYAAAKDACPTGWHLPSNEEWGALWDYIYINFPAVGKALKSTSGWYDNGNGTDDYNFTILPSGYRNSSDGTFKQSAERAYFINSNGGTIDRMIGRAASYSDDNFDAGGFNKSSGISIRCLKN